MIERFPIGRRLAFDGAKGRLWVVCTRCLRWNLTPLEERWEAIEECERLFRASRVRVSTDNVALARCTSGLALVRIGAPLRTEFAIWRYAASFGWRHRRSLAATGAGVAVAATGAVAGLALGAFGAMGVAMASMIVPMAVDSLRGVKTVARMARSNRLPDVFTRASVRDARIVNRDNGDRALHVYPAGGR
jgi:hypothetical protein